ncbi:hypothetical protein KEM48_007074 [Puccinia striiformis f. sp. tritici PST-130]|nr:hypothetical protein KEM48_007074 [Puccinia striiformis f. sp. tritici PST-130]
MSSDHTTTTQSSKGKMKSEETQEQESSNPPKTEAQADSNEEEKDKIQSPPPVCIICIGMAGSGKTTFVQRLNSYLHSIKKPPYILNLDPAVSSLPFQANIDIRDTVNYKQVMKQYNLGPNGGILTALNLFTTKFDQVLNYVEKRSSSTDFVLIDTPGQIEIFTWSASGAIITDAIASSLPTVVAYIIDTPRTTAPATFMSNMLYACSILYKTRLPFLLVFNKTDVQPHDFALEWMQDFEVFQQALVAQSQSNESEGGSGYMSSLMNSMSLVLDEFYKNLRAVGCSAMTGFGMKEFFEAVDEARQEYETERLKQEQKNESLDRLVKDLKLSSTTKKSKVDPTELRPDEVSGWEEAEGKTLDKQDVCSSSDMPKSAAANKLSGMGIESDGLGDDIKIPCLLCAHCVQVRTITNLQKMRWVGSSSSLVFFVLLSLAVACLCLYDILSQTTTQDRPSTIQLSSIVLGSVLLVLLLSLSTSISRYFTVKHSLSLIPKPYIPISQLDLPTPIFQNINQEYGRIAIINYLASKPQSTLRIGLDGWGKPGTVHHGKRFADQILKDLNSLERALDGLVPIQPKPIIPTRQSTTIDGPLSAYMEILSPSTPTQPTPIVLTPAQKLILNKYNQLLIKSLTPSSVSPVFNESDYLISCKCLLILVDQINTCRDLSIDNPVGCDHRNGYQIRTIIITETRLPNPPIKPNNPKTSTSPALMSSRPGSSTVRAMSTPPIPLPLPQPSSSTVMINGKESIDNLCKKIFPLIYPPFLPSGFGPIISGYEALIKDIMVLNPSKERTIVEYQYALRCIGSLISHVLLPSTVPASLP